MQKYYILIFVRGKLQSSVFNELNDGAIYLNHSYAWPNIQISKKKKKTNNTDEQSKNKVFLLRGDFTVFPT